METVEATGPTIKEAIEIGMKELGVDSPSQVMVEVLEEPDQGIMGEGARPARVRLVFMGARPGDKPLTSIVTRPVEVEEPTPIASTPIVTRPVKQDIDVDVEGDEDWVAGEVISDEQANEDALTGREVLMELLTRMNIEAQVEIRRTEGSKPDESAHWVLNIKGDQMNRLIGRRGDTLSSLQYITRLIVSRKLQRRANIVVDAGSYKSKRSQRLRQLANRMADQAVRQRRTVTLEPMPPHERRIIHLTLRKRKDVDTKSVGEGKTRKVTINPVKK